MVGKNIYNIINRLWVKKNDFDYIERYLIERGFDESEVKYAVNYILNKEKQMFLSAQEVADNFNFRFNLIEIILRFFLSLLPLSLALYLSVKYFNFIFPSETQLEFIWFTISESNLIKAIIGVPFIIIFFIVLFAVLFKKSWISFIELKKEREIYIRLKEYGYK